MIEAATFWDRIAEKYAQSPIADMASYDYTLGRTRSYLGADHQVLELGCGTGSTALLLADGVGRITATDISSNMIDIARRKAEAQGITNVHFRVAGVENPDPTGAPWDAVLALNLLHLLPDLPSDLGRIHAMLKPGGVFISKTACLKGARLSPKFAVMKAALPLMQFFGKAPYVNMFTPEELDRMIGAAGFEIVESNDRAGGTPARYIVARKP